MGIKKRVARVAELPLLALRGLVIFPGMLLHFDVGRKKSMLALNEAMTGDQLIFLVAQTDIADDDPGQDGLYGVGVVAKVRQVLKMPGETLRVMVEGLYRAKIREFSGEDPFISSASMKCWSGRSRKPCERRRCFGNAVHTSSSTPSWRVKCPRTC